jgi:Nucleotidyltransferase domain
LTEPSPIELLLAQIVAETVDPNTEAIALGGSRTRGTATRSSDLDVAHFVVHPPPARQKFHALRSGILVTVSQKSLGQERAALAQPDRAIVIDRVIVPAPPLANCACCMIRTVS